MRPPTVLQRGFFICGVGSLLVSVLFSVTGFPAAELFAIIGAIVTLGLYVFFQQKTINKKRSSIARHLALVLLISAIVLKSFKIAAGGFVFLFAFIALLVWFTWSVLEELPPSED